VLLAQGESWRGIPVGLLLNAPHRHDVYGNYTMLAGCVIFLEGTQRVRILKRQYEAMMNPRNLIELQKGDITKVVVDAIVNAANTSLLGGGGVDGAIHRVGGSAILEECRKIIARQGGCKVGQAVITTAGNLPSKFVVHTVGPVWNGGKNDEKYNLAQCYRNSLQLALDNNCKSIAFPNISTGIYKFPKDEAAKIATKTVVEFLLTTDKIDKVIFICFDDDNFNYLEQQLHRQILRD
jgi:O-acetyl-ADP-ribose deacetylase